MDDYEAKLKELRTYVPFLTKMIDKIEKAGDKSKEALVFYYFTTADFYTQGTLEVTEDGSFIAYEDVTGSSEGITRVKSTSSYVDDQFVVTTQYLKNGEWTPEQKRSYSRSQKEVVFK